jgi:glycosyltransferase involved in cell wall biosynthesis
MKILTVLTYYRPHTSGLTIYAERLARAFVKRGHQVTVMTTQYDPSLLLEETIDGVKIIRVPVAARISKGVIAPTFGLVATKLVAQHDVVQMHLPQFDAPGVALRGRLLGRPTVLTYHCDLLLPPGTYTQDYADHSPSLSRYASKLTPILPPVELPDPLPGAVQAVADEHHIKERRPVIGMAARFAAEKGVEVLLDALPTILK